LLAMLTAALRRHAVRDGSSSLMLIVTQTNPAPSVASLCIIGSATRGILGTPHLSDPPQTPLLMEGQKG